jgi:hypothetical protein
MTAWRRFDYTRRAIESLKLCRNVERWRVLIGLNPDGPNLAAIEALCRCVDFAASCRVVVRESNLGCNLNKKLIMDEAFEAHDYVCQFDDDVILAPDALDFLEWARAFGRDREVFATSACGRFADGPVGEDGIAVKVPGFSCYCWGTWRDRWDEIKKPWPEQDGPPYWDDILDHRTRGDRCQIHPLVSRAITIGVEGGLHSGTVKEFKYWAGSPSFAIPDGYIMVQ